MISIVELHPLQFDNGADSINVTGSKRGEGNCE